MGDQGAVPDVLTVPDRTPRVYRNDYAAVYARVYAAANSSEGEKTIALFLAENARSLLQSAGEFLVRRRQIS